MSEILVDRGTAFDRLYANPLALVAMQESAYTWWTLSAEVYDESAINSFFLHWE